MTRVQKIAVPLAALIVVHLLVVFGRIRRTLRCRYTIP